VDKYLFSAGVILLLLEALLLLDDFRILPLGSYFSNQTHMELLASIRRKRNEVNLRRHNSLAWDEASAPEEIYSFDSILTMDNAGADVQLKSGGEIRLNPNTLITFDPPSTQNDIIKIDLKKGSYTAKIQKGQKLEAGPLLISATSDNTNVVIVNQEGKASLKLLSGTAIIKDTQQKTVTTVVAGTIVRFNSPTQSAVPFVPVSPLMPIAAAHLERALSNNSRRKLASETYDSKNTKPSPVLLRPNTESKEKYFNIFGVTSKLSYSRIDSSDILSYDQATLLSDLNAGVSAKWIQHWSNKWETFLNANVLTTNLESATTKPIDNSNKVISGIEIGANDRLSEKWKLIPSFGFQQQFFIRAVTINQLTVDSVPVPFFRIQGDYSFYQVQPFNLGISLGGTYFVPASSPNFTINAGSGYLGKFFLVRQLQKAQVYATGGYERNSQNTSISTQKTQDLSLEIGFAWKLGGEK
jgi:hypothetical protein